MSKQDPNVLLIVLDSVRAQNTSLHRNDRDTTPHLRQFASEATTYVNAIAPGTGSIQSHTSIFTGLHTVQHRMNSRQARVTAETIWDELGSEGYSLGIFSHNPYLSRVPIGLSEPFDYVFSGNPRGLPFPNASSTGATAESGLRVYWQFLRRAIRSRNVLKSILNGVAVQSDNLSWIPYSLDAVSGKEITTEFLDWHTKQDGSWAACLNYMDAHTPYIPRDEHNRYATEEQSNLAQTLDNYTLDYIGGQRPLSELKSLENAYDDCIRQADAEVGKVLEKLTNRGDLDNTLVVITADHGEGFGETGTVKSVPSIGHGATGGPEEGILRIPLVVQRPGQTRDEMIQKPVTLTAFPAIVRSVLGTPSANEKSFTSQKALTSSLCISQSELEMVSAQVETTSEYNKETRIVYEQTENNKLMKHAICGDEVYSFDVTDPTDVVVEKTDHSENIVIDAFSELDTKSSVNKPQSSEVEKDVEQRLKNLGYK